MGAELYSNRYVVVAKDMINSGKHKTQKVTTNNRPNRVISVYKLNEQEIASNSTEKSETLLRHGRLCEKPWVCNNYGYNLKELF